MNSKNNKKIVQKDETKKIDFSDLLTKITDHELMDYYTSLPIKKLEELLQSNIPEQDIKVIKKILKI